MDFWALLKKKKSIKHLAQGYSHSFLNAQHSANPVFASLFGHAHMLISRQDMYDMIKICCDESITELSWQAFCMVFFRNPLF